MDNEKSVLNEVSPDTPLEEYTMKQLQELAITLGVEAPDSFTTKAQILSVIKMARKAQEVSKDEKPIQKVVDNERQDAKLHKSKMLKMKEKLEKQDKVQIMLPLEGKEQVGQVIETWDRGKRIVRTSGAVETVVLNGWCTYIPKGTPYLVPSQVAEILGQAQVQTNSAGNQYKIDRPSNDTSSPEFKTVRDALS